VFRKNKQTIFIYFSASNKFKDALGALEDWADNSAEILRGGQNGVDWQIFVLELWALQSVRDKVENHTSLLLLEVKLDNLYPLVFNQFCHYTLGHAFRALELSRFRLIEDDAPFLPFRRSES